MSEKKKRLVYRSEGTDDIKIVCDDLANANHVFDADAEALLYEGVGASYTIELSVVEMTDEEVASLKEV